MQAIVLAAGMVKGLEKHYALDLGGKRRIPGDNIIHLAAGNQKDNDIPVDELKHFSK